MKGWNNSPYKRSLKNLGSIRFIMLDLDKACYTIHWDADGTASYLETDEGVKMTFGATHENWNRFFRGSFKASEGVMTGKIKFQGEFRAILPYTLKFNNIGFAEKRTSPFR